MSRVQLQLPPVLGISGFRQRGTIWVESPGKPPRIRFQPGCFVRYENKLYEVIYCFRVEANPQEWLYSCEERSTITRPYGHYNVVNLENPDMMDILAFAGAGQLTPRIVREIFKNESEAWSYFCDIPIMRDRRTLSNKKLVQKGELISSGEIS